MDQPTTAAPIVCDMTSAPDTGPERMMEYRWLFAQALPGRERTGEGIPDTVADGVEGLENRLGERGLHIEANPVGTVTQLRHSAVAHSRLAVPIG